MLETYEKALKWIHGIRRFGKKPGLKRMEWMMDKLDHPEKKVPMIHVAGTNGKGSTVTFIRHLLQEQGLVVGTFTSPFIEVFNERISVNGEPISNEQLLALANAIYPLAEALEKTELGGPSEFEVITAMMFLYFGTGQVDVAVVEVGIGGLLDSTNILTPEVSVITTIGMDHMELLGKTLPEIAAQKAGIIKPGVPVVAGNIPKEALEVIEKIAQNQQSPLYAFQKDYVISKWHTLPTWGEQFTYEDDQIMLQPIQLSMLGRHQTENAAAAIKAVAVFSQKRALLLNHEKMLLGLKQAFWPGRMEKISDSPLIVMDGAHNVPGIQRLIETIKQDFAQQEIVILFAALRNKEYSKMIQMLKKVPHVHLILTSFEHERAVTAEDICQEEDMVFFEVWQEALLAAVKQAGEDSVLLITGSLYFISEVRRTLLK